MLHTSDGVDEGVGGVGALLNEGRAERAVEVADLVERDGERAAEVGAEFDAVRRGVLDSLTVQSEVDIDRALAVHAEVVHRHIHSQRVLEKHGHDDLRGLSDPGSSAGAIDQNVIFKRDVHIKLQCVGA